jgi:hypothetical protein
LLNAIEHGNAPIFSLLMAQEGTQLGGRDAAGRTAIELALVDRRNLVFADALAKRGADLDSADSDGSFLKNYLF